MQIKIDMHGIKELGNLCSTLRKQLPYATAQGLNEVAFGAMRGVKGSLDSDLEVVRNTFTARSFQVEKATKSSGQAEVGFLPRAYYMEKLNDKENRSPRSAKYICVPTPFARRGNTIRGLVKSPMKMGAIKLHVDNGKFVILPLRNGNKGIFKRTSKGMGGLTMCYTLVKQTDYNKAEYYDFEKIILREVKRFDFEGILMRNLMKYAK